MTEAKTAGSIPAPPIAELLEMSVVSVEPRPAVALPRTQENGHGR